MKKILFVNISIFLTLYCFSIGPANPYQFYAPDFENLLPFNKTELLLFKKRGVKKIEKKQAEENITTFYFNEKGQLISSQEKWKFKNKNIITSSNYKYNSDDKIISIKTLDIFNLQYDSIEYDSSGIISHYSSYHINFKDKKKNQKKIYNYNLELVSKLDNKRVFIDSSQYRTRKYTLNNDNEIITINEPNQTDSVSFENNGSTKRYWYKRLNDSIFILGRESIYEDNRIQSIKNFDKIWSGTNISFHVVYIYSEKNILQRIERKEFRGNKTFITYYDYGLVQNLPMEVINYHGDFSASISRYRYYFE
jgi:hypothetical protein